MNQFCRTYLVLIYITVITKLVRKGAEKAFRNKPSYYLQDILILPLLSSKRSIFLPIYKISIVI